MKRLIIEQLKEGFIFTDENDDKYAVPVSMLSIRVKAYFGLTKFKPKKEKTNIAPPAKVSEATKPETQGSKTPDSHSGGAIYNYEVERKRSAGQERSKAAIQLNSHAILQNCVTPFDDILPSSSTEQHRSDKEVEEKSKLGTPDNQILWPKDLKIKSFDYSGWSTGQYKSLSFWELPDGRVVLNYSNSHYYTTKDLVMQIPFPFPEGCFDKKNGWSSSVEQAFKMYRRYLAERQEPEGQPDGTCDDVSFDTCANNDPEACKFCVNESRYEDKRKLAVRKSGRPLLKASMGC